MSQVCIRGVGYYVPETRLTNQALATRLGVTDDYIVKLTGVRERRRAAPEEATSDMAVLAAQAALEEGNTPHHGYIPGTCTLPYASCWTAWSMRSNPSSSSAIEEA